VETALAVLTRGTRLPRDQVHEDDVASIRLAEDIGLSRFVTMEHWIVDR
jgi:hypothetical protein